MCKNLFYVGGIFFYIFSSIVLFTIVEKSCKRKFCSNWFLFCLVSQQSCDNQRTTKLALSVHSLSSIIDPNVASLEN